MNNEERVVLESFMKNDTIQALFARWKITKTVGEGAFSQVYRMEAVNESGQTELSALKVELIWAEDRLSDEAARKRFLEKKKDMAINEIFILKKLRECENIVELKDVKVKKVQKEGAIYGYIIFIRMEYLESVSDLMRKKKFDDSEANIKKLAIDIGAGLSRLHAMGIIHRDIKPGNLFYSSQKQVYKLGDFNISKKPETAHTYAGTPGYMAPEIYKAKARSEKQYTEKTDIYSFCLCLYQMMNEGLLPFEDEVDPDEAFDRRMTKNVQLPAPKNASPQWAEIILKGCAYEPELRYQSMEELVNTIRTEAMKGGSPMKQEEMNDEKQRTDYWNSETVCADETYDNGPKKRGRHVGGFFAVFFFATLFLAGLFILFPKLFNTESEESASLETSSYMVEEEVKEPTKRINRLDTYGKDSESVSVKNDMAEPVQTEEATLEPDQTEEATLEPDPEKEAFLKEVKDNRQSNNLKLAICMLKDHKTLYGDDPGYCEELELCCAAYSEAVCKEADQVAQEDHVGALVRIKEALGLIGDDQKLIAKRTEIENAYTEEIYHRVDGLIEQGQFDQAVSELTYAKKYVNNQSRLQLKSEEVEAKRPKFLVDMLRTTYDNDYTLVSKGKAVYMGGIERGHGFYLNVYGWNGKSMAVFNLQKKYTTLSGYIGYVDHQAGDSKTWEARICTEDQRVLYRCTVKPEGMPQKFSIDVTGVQGIIFQVGDGSGHVGDVGFAELTLS